MVWVCMNSFFCAGGMCRVIRKVDHRYRAVRCGMKNREMDDGRYDVVNTVSK